MSEIVETRLRITSVRSRGARGGAIFAGRNDAGDAYVVIADHPLLPDASVIDTAQVWNVAGPLEVVAYSHAGAVRKEAQIRPTRLELQRPSGKNLVAWIAQCVDCRGIGEVRARRLWERFGSELLTLIETRDIATLAEVVGMESAQALVAAFDKHDIAATLVWLDQIGLSRPIAASVARYWGKDAQCKVEANPYVLVSFCAEWKTVDQLALRRFGIEVDDGRRLVAAAEDVLYRAMDGGDTALAREAARSRLRDLLGSTRRADQALAAAVAQGRLAEAGGLVQASGLAHIESFLARALTAMVRGQAASQGEMFPAELPRASAVETSVALYESMDGIELTSEQRQAVVTCATNQVSLILGGAGTGKTTVLKALCHALQRVSPGMQIHQLALAGRAAQRMTQATGRPSKTIAAFLLDDMVAPGSTVLIDEASMIDVILTYRVLRHLPPGVRLVLIGDPAQLPPIGPGLVLHALAGHPSIPQTTLKTVKRQSSASGIPHVAATVRAHRAPRWAAYAGHGSGVSAVACDEAHLDEIVARVYQDLGGHGRDHSVQILSATRNGAGGVRALNALLHERCAPREQPILSRHPEFGPIHERTVDNQGLFVGDLVSFGANDYTLGLRNGALGRIIRAVAPDKPESCVCIAEFEGTQHELTTAHLRHVTHAYAVTTHKSQGSQFDRVIVPVRRTRLLDNALLYTDITRAVEQVVLVGDIAAAEHAISMPSISSRRTTRLPDLLPPAGTG